jgi:hypothetical protein
MPGFSSNILGNDVVFAGNVNFSGDPNHADSITTNGQLLIGTTALNAGGTHINVGQITSPGNTISIGYSSPNITIDLAGGGQSIQTLSSDIGTLITPSPTHNIQLVGHVNEQGATKFSTIVAGTNLANINPMSSSRWIVDSLGFNGTHTTIASAITSATSGDTIFILPGTYTENLTLKAGVNLTAYGSDSSLNGTGKVIISGTCTFTAAGSVTISGIQLQTNSANLLAVTGSAASVVNLINCYLNCTNTTGISFTSSSSSALIELFGCSGNLGTTGIAFHSSSSAGAISYFYCFLGNGGASTTATSNSAGNVFFEHCFVASPVGSTSTGTIALGWTSINTQTQNTTALVLTGTGTSTAQSCSFDAGSASALSVGAGTTLQIVQSQVSSSNASAIAGTGTISSGQLQFQGSSQVFASGLTQIGRPYSGYVGPATSATGFLGERLAASASSVATTSSTPKTITSVTLTPGIWDVSGSWGAQPTGGAAVMSASAGGISTTDNTITGTLGIDFTQLSVPAVTTMSFTTPIARAVVTTNTVYYLVVTNVYTSTTCPTNAKISATRVG